MLMPSVATESLEKRIDELEGRGDGSNNNNNNSKHASDKIKVFSVP